MLQRIITFWVQTLVTERLLANPLFHRIASKTHQHVSISTLTEKGSKHVNEFSKAYTEHLEKEARNQRK